MTSVKKKLKVRGAVRREQIVRASFRVIGKQGVGRLTTAAIAREVGISEANLYRHFRNKEQIYQAAVLYVRDMIARNADAALSGDAPPLVKLKRFFLLQIGLMIGPEGLPRLMFSEELHIHHRLRSTMVDTMTAVTAKLAALVRSGQRNGCFRKDIDARSTALLFIGLVQSLAFRWSLSGYSFSLDREGAKMWRHFARLIAADHGARA